MSEKERNKRFDNCMDRCRFEARNCSLNEDGSWDCSTRHADCLERCSIE